MWRACRPCKVLLRCTATSHDKILGIWLRSPSSPTKTRPPSRATSCARSSSVTWSRARTRSATGAADPATRSTTRQGGPDPARIRTRFPPEPNGYLHVGHAKSICLNFGLARDYGGVCHLRFDDTNPEKEELEYVDGIKDAVRWLGFGWDANGTSHLYQASDYFDFMYRAAEYLIEAGLAYVDEQTPEEMRANRGDFSKPGVDSPFRSRSIDENLQRFREMRDGKLADGKAVLRAKIDMASPNINMRDPTIYRIKHAEHHNTGQQVVHLPDVHLRAPDRGRAGEHHPQPLHAGVRGPAAVLRLAAGSPGRRRADQHAASAPVRIRAAEPHLRDHQQAQAQAAGGPGARVRLGRPAHADHRGPAPARLHAREPAAVRRAHRREQGRFVDRLSARWRSRCATTSTRRPPARWRCWTR